MRRNLLRTILSDSVTHTKPIRRVEEQIQIVEKYINSLKSKVKSYCSVKTSEVKILRQVSTVVAQYAEAEKTSSLKANLNEFFQIISKLREQLEMLSQRIDKEVVSDLSDVKPLVKNLKQDLKSALSALGDKNMYQRQVNKLELARGEQQQIRLSAAEAELEKARRVSAKATSALMEHSDLFESKTLANIRKTLMLWAELEIQYHARALELFTDAYTAAAAIDIEADLEEFRSELMTTPEEALNHRLGVIQSASRGSH